MNTIHPLKNKFLEYTKNNLKDKNGKISSMKCSCSNFTKSQAFCDFKELTKDLQQDRAFIEKLFCIKNDIKETPKCMCGSYLLFYPQEDRYGHSCKKCFKLTERIKLNKDGQALKRNLKSNMEFLDSYISNKNAKYASKEEVMLYINNIKNTYIDKNNSQLISITLYKRDCEIIKGICEYTKHIPYKGDYKYNLSRRMYDISNNINDDVKCLKCPDKPVKYINFTKGYFKHCSSKCGSDSDKWVQKNNKLIGEHFKNNNLKILDDINTRISIRGFASTIQCLKCGDIFKRRITASKWKITFCHKCVGVNFGFSNTEKGIVKFLSELHSDLEVLERTKINNKEIDIYIPKYNLGIEYNGTIWHSFGNTFPRNLNKEILNKDKHFVKYDALRKLDKQLIQINYNYWLTPLKREILESIIINRLKLSNRIYGRKTEIREIKQEEFSNFLISNHLEGSVDCSVRIGLFYENNLVFVMGFKKPNMNKKYKWELSRFCSLKKYVVIGGFNKCLNYFKNKHNPDNLIVYSNLDYSTNKIFDNNGFKFLRVTPFYLYVKRDEIISRYAARKSNQKNLLDVFDPDKTEPENMFENGYRRFWGTGTSIYEYNF